LGIKAMKLADARGLLVGGMVVTDSDEVLAIKASGQVTRSAASDVPAKGRDTMGVKFVTVADSDSVVAIARNPEAEVEEEGLDEAGLEPENGDEAVSARASAAAEDVTSSSIESNQEDSQDSDPAEAEPDETDPAEEEGS
jgi:DNA gyrase subunit A